MPKPGARKKGAALGLGLEDMDDLAPQDWDPEADDLELDPRAAASLQKAKGAWGCTA